MTDIDTSQAALDALDELTELECHALLGRLTVTATAAVLEGISAIRRSPRRSADRR